MILILILFNSSIHCIFLARTLQFLIMFLVSDWSDKHSKRKMCLWIPLCGQLAISIGLCFTIKRWTELIILGYFSALSQHNWIDIF